MMETHSLGENGVISQNIWTIDRADGMECHGMEIPGWRLESYLEFCWTLHRPWPAGSWGGSCQVVCLREQDTRWARTRQGHNHKNDDNEHQVHYKFLQNKLKAGPVPMGIRRTNKPNPIPSHHPCAKPLKPTCTRYIPRNLKADLSKSLH